MMQPFSPLDWRHWEMLFIRMYGVGGKLVTI